MRALQEWVTEWCRGGVWVYAGVPAAVEAFRAAKEVFDEIDKKTGRAEVCGHGNYLLSSVSQFVKTQSEVWNQCRTARKPESRVQSRQTHER